MSAADAHRVRLPLPEGERARLARAWLALAIAALLASGIFSILLVAARTPVVQHAMPGIDFFRVALVVHVDLSVLVWFASFAALLWTLAARSRGLEVGWIAWSLVAMGTAGVALAPFVDPGQPVMSNYVPVLASGVFLWGLLVVAAGFGIAAMWALLAMQAAPAGAVGELAWRVALRGAAFAAVVALGAGVVAWRALPMELDPRAYYEALFWGAGHAVQFCWTLVAMLAWLWLADATGVRVPMSPRMFMMLCAVAVATVATTPVIESMWDVATAEHQRAYALQMRYGGGLAVVPVVVAVLVGLARAGKAAPGQDPCRQALVASVALFCVGGVIGFLIEGSNVRIPAHYHGSIVGVTLALMGLSYALLPRLGFDRPLPRIATWQPHIYGAGQLMHVAGLVWSGGYGVQRKVAGAEQVLRTPAEIAGMGLMGLGGLVAVLGGLVFAVVVLRTLVGERR